MTALLGGFLYLLKMMLKSSLRKFAIEEEYIRQNQSVGDSNPRRNC